MRSVLGQTTAWIRYMREILMSLVGHRRNMLKCHDGCSYFCIFISAACAMMLFPLKGRARRLVDMFPSHTKIIYKRRTEREKARPFRKPPTRLGKHLLAAVIWMRTGRGWATWRCVLFVSPLRAPRLQFRRRDGALTNNSERHPAGLTRVSVARLGGRGSLQQRAATIHRLFNASTFYQLSNLGQSSPEGQRSLMSRPGTGGPWLSGPFLCAHAHEANW